MAILAEGALRNYAVEAYLHSDAFIGGVAQDSLGRTLYPAKAIFRVHLRR